MYTFRTCTVSNGQKVYEVHVCTETPLNFRDNKKILHIFELLFANYRVSKNI